jgi:hypothetical protein
VKRTAAQLRADVARAAKAGEDTTTLRQEEALARIVEHARSIVEKAPPLTVDQRDRLAVLLRGEA